MDACGVLDRGGGGPYTRIVGEDMSLTDSGVDMQHLPVQPMRGALIPARVLEEVELMVILSVPPGVEGDDLGHNLLACRQNKKRVRRVSQES